MKLFVNRSAIPSMKYVLELKPCTAVCVHVVREI
jgi:hypothetical protein